MQSSAIPLMAFPSSHLAAGTPKANYTDATIAVEGKFYPVHKLVMSTCSEYFSEIFERTPCKSPVVVLKDVRSQDMDALLDYMYLGEVNVNQNDLASLLKTAECLRIKGLAVPDEDPTKARKNLPDDRRESPPPKRRRHEDSTSSSTSAHQPPRPVSPSAPSPTKATAGGQAQAPPVQQHSSSHPPNSKSQQDLDTSVDPPPMVKVEMEEADDPDDGYRRDNSFDGGQANDGDAGDFGSEVSVSKSEHDPEGYGGGGSYAGPSLHQGGDLPWEEGDSSSFPPEGFSGDLPAGQQPQGDVWPNWYMEDERSELNVVIMRKQCIMCNKRFRSQADLGRHMRTHTGEKPFKCPYCDRRMAQKGNLKAHVKNGLSGLVCGQLLEILEETGRCSEDLLEPSTADSFSQVLPINSSGMSSLTHSSSTVPLDLDLLSLPGITQGVRPPVRFFCSMCPKGFRSKVDKERHMRTHTGEKPFKCPYCPHCSATKGNLKAHMRHIHTDIRLPF
ncbi:hypothetical protein Pcinc_038730 [Petrolisthes cinctipes]|uniref:Uncharacterized protein n=2 Tax=Petrolisthes cinctipes TaxID=88211 RepID=A0AAE1BR90_PETCI|nr:hypothetical protein Pcinc_038730 [Petrolisthes cinctipes]